VKIRNLEARTGASDSVMVQFEILIQSKKKLIVDVRVLEEKIFCLCIFS
jgi:hypothetical protein